jgi:hypothetical protein
MKRRVMCELLTQRRLRASEKKQTPDALANQSGLAIHRMAGQAERNTAMAAVYA